MIRTQPICKHEASLVAVAALDELVGDILHTCRLQISPCFLDWVADEATWLVEHRVMQSFDTPWFSASLRKSDHRLAIRQWVGLWVYPGIALRFQELARYLPEFAPGSAVTAARLGVQPLRLPAIGARARQRRPAMGLASPA